MAKSFKWIQTGSTTRTHPTAGFAQKRRHFVAAHLRLGLFRFGRVPEIPIVEPTPACCEAELSGKLRNIGLDGVLVHVGLLAIFLAGRRFPPGLGHDLRTPSARVVYGGATM